MPIWPFTRRSGISAISPDIPLCALPRPLDLDQIKRALVFAPHPDDETLGCGGTIAQLAGRCAVKVVLVTDGSGAGELPPGTVEKRHAEFVAALARLGVLNHEALDQPDGAFAENQALGNRVRKIIADFKPDYVFLPAPVDYHRDHLRIAEFLTPLCRQSLSVEFLVHYEVWAPIPATHVVDITDQWEQKMAALSEHLTAMACGDYKEAIRGLNRYRGLYIGRNRMAEAFMVEPTNQPSLFSKLLDCSLRIIQSIGGLSHNK